MGKNGKKRKNGRKRLSVKQLMFAKGKAAGLDNTAAAKKAGYACPMQAGHEALRKIEKHPDFLAMMDRAGLSERKLFKPIKDALGATKTGIYEGDVCASEEPDHDVRLKAVEIGFRLNGRLRKTDEQPSPAAEARKELHLHFHELPKEKLMEIIQSKLTQRE